MIIFSTLTLYSIDYFIDHDIIFFFLDNIEKKFKKNLG